MTRLLELLRRGARASPARIARWLARQAAAELDQHRAPGRARRLTEARLLAELGAGSLEALWARLAAAPFPGVAGPVAAATYEQLCPGDAARIAADADAAVERRVDLLGSGPVALGRPIDWHTDFKTGHSWPRAPFRRLDVLDLDRASDVKVPWELSRLQWLLPAGQAYLLGGDERYAEAARAVIDEWAAANPLARGVNWACTMDVALRGIALVWLFRAFHASDAWNDDRFRLDFLRLLYLHGDFTRRHLEWSDVNGNHLLADAAGLAVIGLFLGGRAPGRWAEKGWKILAGELPRQVFADGVDFEMAAAYHRLVLELFLLPALHRRALGLPVAGNYADALRRMARFVAAYGRDDGSSPLWGDADDGRALPFGPQPVTDHRYLIGLVGLAFDDADLLALASGPAAEIFWLLGADAAAKLPAKPRPPGSQGFPDGGVYVMRAPGGDHVFIDCGPVGLAGRGGHGHNDCLGVEAALAGARLLTDCGAYVYSADAEWRNSFRSTAFHNTPVIDGEEQNRFVRPEYLWTLMDDAKPEVRHWQAGDDVDTFVGAHAGYRRLARPLTPVRAVTLHKRTHRLVVVDAFAGAAPDVGSSDGDRHLRVPYHFAPGVAVEAAGPGVWRLATPNGAFLLVAGDMDLWTAALGDGWVSPRYGVKARAKVLNFIRDGRPMPLAVALMPADGAPADVRAWLADEAEKTMRSEGMRKV